MSTGSDLKWRYSHFMFVSVLVLVLSTANAALAQSFNLDFGSVFGTPASSFGAAAGQPGVWQQIASLPAGGCDIHLDDTSGSPTPARLNWLGCAAGTTIPGFSFNNPGTSGDNQALLDDALDVPDGAQIIIYNLEPGAYQVYVYAWAPDNATYITGVDGGSNGCDNGQQCLEHIGGAWPGSLEEGVVYEVYAFQAEASGGGGLIYFKFSTVSGLRALNAIQIIQLQASGEGFNLDFGSGFGTPASSFGAAAGQPGVWQQIASLPAGGCNIPLNDISGSPTAARLSWSGCIGTTISGFSFDNPGTSGNNQALLDDALDVPDGGVIRIDYLEPGAYQVYVYAWAPDNSTYITGVDGASNACGYGHLCLENIGGAWPGDLEEGVVYEVYAFQVRLQFSFVQLIEFAFSTVSGPRTLNAIQIVKLEPAGPCSDIADCADANNNGIRDDNCIWSDCAGGTCNNIGIIFADMGGAFGACPPDGFCNLQDRNHALTCFAGLNPCPSLNIDAGGAFGSCAPDGFCNIHDATHALRCFSGTNTCVCPSPGPAPEFDPVVVAGAHLIVSASHKVVGAGDKVAVQVYIGEALANLQGYQLHLGVSGGKQGSLELVDITIEDRADAVFDPGASNYEAFNVSNAQMLKGLEAGGVPTSGKGYLATYTYRASDDAFGTFIVDVLHDETAGDQTFLVSDFTKKIGVTDSKPAVIDVRDILNPIRR